MPFSVTVTGERVAFALDDALKVTVELPAPLIELGLKLAVTLLGRPLADKFTFDLKPLTAAVENVTVPVLPLDPCLVRELQRLPAQNF